PDEIRLRGGAVTEVVRVGDTVRRPPGPRAAYVRELLRFLEQRGWSAAPRYLGVDDKGRETLTFVSGEVPWQQPVSMRSDAGLVRLVCDAYGLGDRTELLDTVLWWQDRCWRGIEAEAAAGDPAKRALLERGIPATIRTEHAWVVANRVTLESAL